MASRILKTTLSRLFATEVVETPELFLKLTGECMEQVDRMTRSSTVLKVNHEQCKYLADKLKRAVQSATSFLELISTWYSPSVSAQDMVRSLEIFKLLLALGKEVENLIAGCCKDPWVQSAIMLTNVSEHVLSLGLNLELCSIIFSNRKKFVALPSVEVAEVALVRDTEAQIAKEMAKLDETRLVGNVSVMVESSRTSSIDLQLALFLRERLKRPRQFPNPALLGSNESAYFEILDQGLNQLQRLGGGSFGTVYKATWLGTDVAKKTFCGPSVEDLIQEVSILEGLCHPNIVSLLWYWSHLHKCYIVMELMDRDLFTLIQDRLEGCAADDNPFSISEAMHIIAQVAEGVCFLHRNKIVHRDLKSGNILVRLVKPKEVDVTCIQVKVADFGLSRTRENSATASSLTLNQGTTRWMAPEMIELANNHDEIELSKFEERLHYPFKVDVFSFGMLCYEVLSGKVPFSSTSKPNEVRRKILAGDRPQLPNQCPEGLRTLIKKCWNPDPCQRPSFAVICAELRHLQCGYFITSTWARAPRCFSLNEIWRMTNKFSKDNLLSWKALTMVYKGVTIDTGETVAVKRILEENFRLLDEFKTQMEMLAGLHHKNLVRTVGFCYAEEEAILVFEYMPNDTLDTCLSEDDLNLTWPVRRNICLGVANGIYYLHSLTQPRIIHRHIRRCNIMLDQNFEPKISGLQSALLSSNTISDFQSPQLGASSLGYLAPECETPGEVSDKVDVYSFGVLLLEIVSGRRNFDPTLPEGQRDLGEWARELHSQGRMKEFIDPALDLHAIGRTEALRTILIALLCMHTAVETRPEMNLVFAMLQGNLDEEILRLGLQFDKELFGMCVDELPDSFGFSCGAFGSSSRWKLDHFVRAEGRLAAEWSVDPSDSRDGPDLEREAEIGLEYLSSTSPPKVREGFSHLIKCASRSGGPFAVFNAKYFLAAPPGLPVLIKAIPAALKLAGDTQYSKLAMNLMVVLTSDKRVGSDENIILEVALDVLISLMKGGSHNSISLLAAETVGNILVNKQVRKALYRYDGFLAALGAFLNLDASSQSMKHLERATDLGLKVLQRLAKCSESSGEKAQLIVAALIKLLRRGLGDTVLRNLAKDTLVFLDTQVLVMDHRFPTLEICLEVRSRLLELMVTDGFISHSTIPGRMAIFSLMTKLCELYKEGITEGLCLYLLKMMKSTGFELMQLSDSRANEQELNDLKRLLGMSVRLLCFCVTHNKNSFEGMLTKNVAERSTLEVLLEQNSGVPDESKVGILELFDHIDKQSICQRPTAFGEVAILVKLAKSQSPACRSQVASRLLKFASGKLDKSRMEGAGGINALMDFLNDKEVDCQKDALLALYLLSPSIAIQTEELPFKIILGFLHPKWPSNVRDAAVGFLQSQSPACRAQVASRLLKFATGKLHNSEIEGAECINALMDLLNDKGVDCQKYALLALYLLSPSIAIRTKELPFKIILGFLHPKWPSFVRDAAAGFLHLMVKESAANAKKFMETPAALKAVLLCLDRDAESPSCQISVSALLIMATEEDDAVRFGIAGAGLSILVTFVQRFGTIEHKKLLTIMLRLLCKSGTDCEEAVTKANGHTFLLICFEENISKDAATQGLLSLLSNATTRGDVLQAGFVEIAIGSIDREYVSTEMALGLASVCSTPDGLDQIVACSRSVGALLILLENCPTIDGKGAAAAVIAKLYSRLNSNGDLIRQGEMTDACSHLIRYLDHEDRSQLQEFLKALAAFATGKKGRQIIDAFRGQVPLMRFLKDREIDTQVRDLVLQILAEMNSVFDLRDGVTMRDSSYHKILNVFLDHKIGVLPCAFTGNVEFRENTESMKNLLILFRNLSLTGPAACSHLCDAGVVNLLLNVLSDHGSSLSPVTELAVNALLNFMDDPSGRRAFLNGGGIQSLASILKLGAESPYDRNLTIIIPIILASVAEDPRTGGAACTAIFNCDILQALNTIMYDGETSRVKCQAAVLMKLLATNGPTNQVCAAIYNAGTLDALIYLRTQAHCEDVAHDVLKYLRGKNSDCRKYIDVRFDVFII